MNTRWLNALLTVVVVTVAAVALAQSEPKANAPAAGSSALPSCPVMSDEPVNLAVSVESPDGPVFFCCKDCIKKYQSEPSKYAAKTAAQRKALADRPKVQVGCPACAQPADLKIFMEDGGKKTYFSSTECMAKYKAEPGKYASALANSYSYQTVCPVMGEGINPKSFVTVADGSKVYLCCKGCDKKLFADPAKYAPKLAAQGFTYDAKTLVAASDKEHKHDHAGHKHDHGGHDHDHD